MKKQLLFLTALLSISMAGFATNDVEAVESTEVATSEVSSQEAPTSKVSLKPQLFGAVRVKYEQSTFTGVHRFNVRNSRIGVKGNASENMRYAIQIDFNNEGKVSILDSYVAYKYRDFEFSLGQQQYHFSRDLDRGPSSSLFSNRSFLAKYLTTYYGSSISNGSEKYYVSSIGSRDIGALVSYKSRTDLPFSASVGAFNGTGANNPEWGNSVNFIGRFMLGGEDGLSASASYYYGSTPDDKMVITNNGVLESISHKQDVNMYGFGIRYAGENFLIESEFAERNLYMNGRHTITAAHVHGYRIFHLDEKYDIDHLAPHLRWDMGDGIEFINKENFGLDRYDANRITVALNIGFAEKWIASELRLAYEEYIVGTNHTDAQINPLLHDKFTIELIASF